MLAERYFLWYWNLENLGLVIMISIKNLLFQCSLTTLIYRQVCAQCGYKWVCLGGLFSTEINGQVEVLLFRWNQQWARWTITLDIIEGFAWKGMPGLLTEDTVRIYEYIFVFQPIYGELLFLTLLTTACCKVSGLSNLIG